MSYDEQRISDQIDAGLHNEKMQMNSKIIVVGRYYGALQSALQSLQLHELGDVIVVGDDFPKQLPSPKDEPFIIKAAPIFEAGKKFICKGKHQYRNENGKWICQCGRTI